MARYRCGNEEKKRTSTNWKIKKKGVKRVRIEEIIGVKSVNK